MKPDQKILFLINCPFPKNKCPPQIFLKTLQNSPYFYHRNMKIVSNQIILSFFLANSTIAIS